MHWLKNNVCRSRVRLGFSMLLLMSVWMAPTAIALDPNCPPEHYRIRSWSHSDGLPTDSVHFLAQDSTGYLWVAVEDGVTRFDGVNFTGFSPSTVAAFPSSLVDSLAVSEDGTLWLGTASGVVIYDGMSFVRVEDPFTEGRTIQALAPSMRGGMWVGTEIGLGYFSSVEACARVIEEMEGHNVRALFESGDGILWIGTQKGLFSFDGTHVTPISVNRVGQLAPVSGIDQDLQGAIWIVTNGQGAFEITDGDVRSWTEENGLPTDSVLAVECDRDGNVWLGTNGAGLIRINDDTVDVLSTRDGLSGDLIRSIFEDREGHVWIGAMGGGLSQLSDTPFISWSHDDGLASDLALTTLAAKDGSVWIGSDKGLSGIRGRHVQVFDRSDGIPNNLILSLAEAPGGQLWVGTSGGGLALGDDQGFAFFAGRETLGTDLITALLVRHDGSLIVGTHHGGVFQLRDGSFSRIGPPGWLETEGIFCLAEDSRSRLWVSGQRSGLFRLEGNNPTRLAADFAESGAPALSILELDEDRFLIGCGGTGLLLMDADSVTQLGRADGLPDDVIMNLQMDDLGFIWAGTHHGIFRISEQELLRLFKERHSPVGIDLFNTNDGLASAECNAGFFPAGAKSPDGRLWFPTTRGVAVVDPNRLERDEHPPEVVIEAVAIGQDYARVEPHSTVELPVSDRRIEVTYTAFDYYDPENLTFEYTLEGFDQGWVSAGKHRKAHYTNLPPGSFTFRVRAHDSHGLSSLHSSSLTIQVPGRFSESWAFYGLFFGAAVLLGFAVARRRIAALQKREAELTELVRQREQAEVALVESETRFRELFENANDIIMTLDRDGRITACNREAEQAFGMDPAQLIGTPFVDLAVESHRDAAQQILSRTLDAGLEAQGRLVLSSRTRRTLVVELKTRAIEAKSKIVGLQGIARDVSVRESLENELRQAQKMEAIGRLAGGVAHDINNVLTIIIGQSDILKMSHPNAQDLIPKLNEIIAAGQRGADMTRKLLTFSRRQIAQTDILDLNTVINEASRFVMPLLGEDIQLDIELHSGELWICADKTQIEQIIMNLAINARDAMPEGGRLTIRTRQESVPAPLRPIDTSGQRVILEVEDDGCGMDPATAAQVFDPFFTTKTAEQGTGLGLSTVYGIVHQAHGTVSVETEPGRGSCFRVSLPQAQALDADAPAAQQTRKLDTIDKVVLVVEDDPDVRAATMEMISILGCTVFEADCSERAWQQLDAHPEIDIVLTDIVMPNGRGDRMALEMSRSRSDLKFILVSGYSDRAPGTGEETPNHFQILQKPVGLTALAAALRSSGTD